MSQNIRKFFIAGAIITLVTTAGYLIAPIEVRYINTLTDNTVLVGTVFAFGSILFSIFSLFLGRLSDKYGRDRFLIIGLLAGIIYPLLYASTYNVFQYLGVKFVWVFSAVAIGPIFTAYIQDLLEDNDKKGQYIGTLFSIQAISGSVGALLGGVLSDSFGLKAPYFVLSIFFVIAFLVSLTQFSFKKTKSIKTEKRSLFFALGYIFKKPLLFFWFLQNTSFSLNWGIKPLLWPLIIFGMTQSDTMTGVVFASMGVVAFFVLPFAGKFADKKGPVNGMFLSTAILSILGLVLVFTDNTIMFWIAASLYAVGEALSGTSEGVLLTDNIEKKYRGEVLGFNSIIDKILQTISPFLAGLLMVYLLPQTVLLCYILLYWIFQFFSFAYYQKNIKLSKI